MDFQIWVRRCEAWSWVVTGYVYAYSLRHFAYSLISCHKSIENLEALVNLEELWLGKNKVAKLEVGSKQSGISYES